MSTTLKLDRIHKSFLIASNKITVIQNLSFVFSKEHTYAIMGTSGSGKSTLLQLMSGLVRPDSGSVTINHHQISEMSDIAHALLLNEKIGIVFQQSHFIPELNVLENIMLPAFIKTKNKQEALKKAHHLLELLELTHLMNNPIKALSGGEQQRISVARALCNKPDFLLADEPTTALDQKSSTLFLSLLKKAHKEEKVGIILSTHALHIAEEMETQLILDQGNLSLKKY